MVVIANHKAGLSELNRNVIGTLSELNRNSIGTTSEVVGTMSEVSGTFTKPALELYRRLSELCMYMSEVVGTFTNPLSAPPFCLLLRLAVWAGRIRAIWLICVLCWAWWWLFLPCRKRVAAAQRCLRRVVVVVPRTPLRLFGAYSKVLGTTSEVVGTCVGVRLWFA